MEEYNVYLDEKAVGIVQMHKKGLFYNVHCRCSLHEQSIHRLTADCDGRIVDLGICIPYFDGFGIDTMIKASNLNAGDIKFTLSTEKISEKEFFVPIHVNTHFNNIDIIMYAKFERRNGVPGLYINVSREDI